MMQFGFIGICAGAAAALLFASVTSGTLLSILLFYLAPLPIMIAGIGWSHWAALIAAIVSSVALGGIFGGMFSLAFGAGIGAPAWWLSYLTMLARPATAAAGGPIEHRGAGHDDMSLEWYPPGRLVVWAAALAALIVIAAIPNFGFDAESFRAGLHEALARTLQIETGTETGPPLSMPGVSNPHRVIDFLVEMVPPAAAVLATLANLFNLWLAARIAKFSGRLARPWPQLSAMTFPSTVLALFAVAIALSFSGGLVGIIAGVLSASLVIAYGVLGFAVMHDITRGIANRPFFLGGIYAAVLMFGWPILALCLLGLAETLLGLRARLARKRGPPHAA